jgi:hypothetical protein
VRAAWRAAPCLQAAGCRCPLHCSADAMWQASRFQWIQANKGVACCCNAAQQTKCVVVSARAAGWPGIASSFIFQPYWSTLRWFSSWYSWPHAATVIVICHSVHLCRPQCVFRYYTVLSGQLAVASALVMVHCARRCAVRLHIIRWVRHREIALSAKQLIPSP